jgi:hypothetical protein
VLPSIGHWGPLGPLVGPAEEAGSPSRGTRARLGGITRRAGRMAAARGNGRFLDSVG